MLINSQFMLAEAKKEKSPEQVKAEVLKRGTGEKAKVKVKLRDGSDLRGYISKADQDSFEVRGNTGKTVTLSYGDVVNVQKPGMSKAAKIGIVCGAGAFLFAAGLASALASLGP